jgi:hypothetical protein
VPADFWAVDFLAVDFFAVDLLVVDFFAVDLLVVDFLAVDFFAVDFLAVDFLAAGMFTSSRTGSRSHALQAPALPFAHPSPHPIPLVAAKGVVQALDADGAIGADPLGLPGRPTLLGEEDLGVVISATGPVLPWNEMMHGLSPKLHLCNSGPDRAKIASPAAGLSGRARSCPWLNRIVTRWHAECNRSSRKIL